MKQVVFTAFAAMLLFACKKETTTQNTTPQETPLTANSVEKRTSQEMERLVRAWTEWTYGRSVSVSPVSDLTGEKQYAAQPYQSEIFLLAGANHQSSNAAVISREITIDLKKSQYVFLPLINLTVWYDECDPSFAPAQNQQPADFFRPFLTDAFEQNDNQLLLNLDKTSVITTSNQANFRASSGIWSFRFDPSQNNDCTAPTSTTTTDGYWALVKLTPGKHTIELGGRLKLESYHNYEASNRVNYVINAR